MPCVAGVGVEVCETRLPSRLTMAALVLVPPRSMPMAQLSVSGRTLWSRAETNWRAISSGRVIAVPTITAKAPLANAQPPASEAMRPSAITGAPLPG